MKSDPHTVYSQGKRLSRLFRLLILPFFSLSFLYRAIHRVASGPSMIRMIVEAGPVESLLQMNYAPVFYKTVSDTVFLILFMVAVLSFPGFWNRLDRFYRNLDEQVFLTGIFLFSFLFSLTYFYYNCGFFPYRGDEFAFLFQSKILASGKLFLPSHPLQKFFMTDYILDYLGKTYSQYTLGNPFFLMLGELFHAPWLVNPVLGAGSLVLIYFVLHELFGIETARYGLPVIAVSPFFVGQTTSYLSHIPSLFCLSGFFFLLIRARKNKSLKYFFLAGLTSGFGFHIRTLTTIVLVALVLSWWAGDVIISAAGTSEKSRYLKENLFQPVLSMTGGFLLPFGLLLLVNYLQNGQPFLFGHKIYNGPRKTFGFSAEYTFKDAWLSLVFRLKVVSAELLPQEISPALVITGLTAAMILLRGKSKYLVLAALAGICAAYLPVLSTYRSARYYFIPFIYAVPLIGTGLNKLLNLLKEKDLLAGKSPVSVFPLLTVLVLFFALRGFPVEMNKYYLAMSKPKRIIEEKKVHHAIVFFRSTKLFYPKWHIRNSPNLDDDVLFALDLGKENKKLMDYYPDRSYYILDNKNLIPHTIK